MAVHVLRQTHRPRLSLSTLEQTAQAILAYLGEQRSELSLLLVSNRKIKTLNYRFRNKNEPTDVLSFPLGEGLPTGERVLGDVVISLERAQQQAKQTGGRFEEEVTRLLIHGILHLLGYDHERSEKDAKIMRKMEKKIRRALCQRWSFRV